MDGKNERVTLTGELTDGRQTQTDDVLCEIDRNVSQIKKMRRGQGRGDARQAARLSLSEQDY